VWRPSQKNAHVLGLLVGALATSLLLVSVGSLVAREALAVRSVAVIILTAILILIELQGRAELLPQRHRQVQQWVVQYGHLGPFQFGVEMGTGIRTFMPSSLPYVAAVALLGFPSLPNAVIAAMGFAVGRASSSLMVRLWPEISDLKAEVLRVRWIRSAVAIFGMGFFLASYHGMTAV
jgi:hypothetical protein